MRWRGYCLGLLGALTGLAILPDSWGPRCWLVSAFLLGALGSALGSHLDDWHNRW